MSLILHETLKINAKTIAILSGNLIHCIDSDENYYDTTTGKRIFVGFITYLNIDSDRTSIISPVNDMLYFVKATNVLYKYNNGWSIITNYEVVLPANVQLTLTPGIITKRGKKIAPATTTGQVFDEDGRDLKTVLDDFEKTKTIRDTRTVKALTNNQNAFSIPYPISPYDLEDNIMIISYNGQIQEEDTYTFSPDKNIVYLTIDIPINDLVTFDFFYSDSTRKMNANTVNNIRIFLNKPDTPIKTDVVLNFYERRIQQYDGIKWVDLGIAHGMIFKRSVTTLTANANTIQINIDGYDKNNDSLMVFQNSTFLDDVDYAISDDSKSIQNAGGQWEASVDEPTTVSILCLKNVPTLEGKFSGVDILDNTIPLSALSEDVRNKINRNFATQSDLTEAITDNNDNILGNVASNLNKLEYLAGAVDNDPLFSEKIKSSIDQMREDINNLIYDVRNLIIINVTTEDNQSVIGQNITVINNLTDEHTTYAITSDTKMTIVVNKFTSYTVGVDKKTGYITPKTSTFPSGHLGDVINLEFQYQK